MNTILTAAGLALCTTLLGDPEPTYDQCARAISIISPQADFFDKYPTLNESCPDSMKKTCEEEHKIYDKCTEWATFDIDGSKGSKYFCTRNAKLIWLPDGRWSWQFGDSK